MNRFQRLLAQAATRFELDGARAESGEAYGEGTGRPESIGSVNCRLGRRTAQQTRGHGRYVRRGKKRGLTVVWIDAKQPHNWQVLDAATEVPRLAAGLRVMPDGTGSSAAVAAQVAQILELPKLAEDPQSEAHHKGVTHDTTHSHHNRKEPHDKKVDAGLGLKLFYAENRPRFTLAVFWKIFVRGIGDGKLPKVRFKLDEFRKWVKDDWPADRANPIGQIVDRLRPFYAWPDGLAVLYADRYRSAFTSNYLTACARCFPGAFAGRIASVSWRKT